MATITQNIQQAISDFGNIKNAIIDRGIEVPAGTPTKNYPSLIRSIDAGSGGGSVINGRIETLTVAEGNSVVAGDFVSNFDDVDQLKVSATDYTGGYFSAVMLSDERLFVVQALGNISTTCATTYDFENDVWKQVDQKTLQTTTNCTVYIKAVKLSESAVLVLSSTNATSYIATARICTVNSAGVIVAGTMINVATAAKSATEMQCAIAFSEEKAVAFQNGGGRLAGRVIKISGTSITMGTLTNITEVGGTGSYKSAVALSASKGLVAFISTTESDCIRIAAFFVNDTDITVENIYTVPDVIAKYQGIMPKMMALERVSETKAILFCPMESFNNIIAIGLVLSDDNVIDSDWTLLDNSAYATKCVLACTALDTDRAFMVYAGGAFNAQYATCRVEDSGRVTVEEKGNLGNTSKTQGYCLDVASTEEKIIVPHGTMGANGYFSVLTRYHKKVKEFSGIIKGIAKTSTTNGGKIQVYVP